MYLLESPKDAHRYLRTIERSSDHLKTSDGTEIKNLVELYNYLKTCDKDTFQHHVTGAKNDFAEWVGVVVGDAELAWLMNDCVLRYPMHHRLLLRINYLVSQSTRKLDRFNEAKFILESPKTHEEIFITSNGRILKNLWELHDFLAKSSEEEFRVHVNGGINKLADWILESVGDGELFIRVADIQDKREMTRLVRQRLEGLEGRVQRVNIPPEHYAHQIKNAIVFA